MQFKLVRFHKAREKKTRHGEQRCRIKTTLTHILFYKKQRLTNFMCKVIKVMLSSWEKKTHCELGASEKETSFLVKTTRRHSFRITIWFHAKCLKVLETSGFIGNWRNLKETNFVFRNHRCSKKSIDIVKCYVYKSFRFSTIH